MYSTVINFKENIPEDVLCSLKETCEKAFNNRAGKATGRCKKTNGIIFEGGEDLYGCLQLGVLALDESEGFKSAVSSWEWIDEDPDENHDVLEALAIPIYY
jgi:hypothetical protein